MLYVQNISGQPLAGAGQQLYVYQAPQPAINPRSGIPGCYSVPLTALFDLNWLAKAKGCLTLVVCFLPI